MRKVFILCLLAIGLAGCRARLEPPAAAAPPALIPQPLEMTAGGGRFVLTPGTVFSSAGAEAAETDRREAARLLHDLEAMLPGDDRGASFSLPSADGRPAVRFFLEPGETARLGDEGYALRISGGELLLRAARPAGLFYGVQTLRQLLLERLDDRGRPRLPLSLPCLEIVDRPRYSWRGFMLDCCRHFFSKEFIKKCLDGMALHKLNRFHWHLTDDQGWRIEIAKYPELTRNGGFYSRDDIREIVAYAAERFITVVPEIEMPGHATAALSVYPRLSCTGGPFAAMPQWGVFADVYCAGSEETFAFLENVLDEVAELFPGPWVHVGGDECPKERWNACPRCQARLRAEGLADAGQLQGWFVGRVEEHLRARGKRLDRLGRDPRGRAGARGDGDVVARHGGRDRGRAPGPRRGHGPDVIRLPRLLPGRPALRTAGHRRFPAVEDRLCL